MRQLRIQRPKTKQFDEGSIKEDKSWNCISTDISEHQLGVLTTNNTNKVKWHAINGHGAVFGMFYFWKLAQVGFRELTNWLKQSRQLNRGNHEYMFLPKMIWSTRQSTLKTRMHLWQRRRCLPSGSNIEGCDIWSSPRATVVRCNSFPTGPNKPRKTPCHHNRNIFGMQARITHIVHKGLLDNHM